MTDEPTHVPLHNDDIEGSFAAILGAASPPPSSSGPPWTPDQKRRALTGELYRCRLTVHDQQRRIAEANFTLREAMRRPHARNAKVETLPEQWRLKTEVQFLLTAARGVYRMAQGLRAVTDGDVRSCVERAISRFDKAVPHAIVARDLHEHMDAYIRGKGMKVELPLTFDQSGFAFLEDGVHYILGGLYFSVQDIADGAETLATALRDCMPDMPSKGRQ